MSEAGARYSRRQVDRAGALLKDEAAPAAGRAQARPIFGWWRGRHRFPLLEVRGLVEQRTQLVTTGGFVALRLKRLPSVEAKLRRFPAMHLSRMQDLGGCRAVVPSVREVDALAALCRDIGPHRRLRENDYLEEPKRDGYRGVHLVWRYRTETPDPGHRDGLRIEIQIRSRLQHAWATAVETVDVLRETQLKIGGSGNGDWRRFFALMGTVHALEEECPIVPGTPSARAELRAELRDLVARLDARRVFAGHAVEIEAAAEGEGAGWTLMNLDASARRLALRRYAVDRIEEAQQEYLRLEERHDGDPAVQVCLVSTDSADTLRRAYPNYFLDVGLFADSLRRFLGDSAAVR